MSVAIGIEIEVAGRAEPDLGLVLAGAHREAQSANRSGAASSHVASSSQPGLESFCSSLQSQLASLVAAVDTAGANETETNASAIDTKGIDAAAESICAATAENQSAATLTSTAGYALRWSLAAGQERGMSAGTMRPALLTSHEQIPAITPSIERPSSTSIVGDAKGSKYTHPLYSAVAHPATTCKSIREKSVYSSAVPDSALASLGITPLTLPATGSVIRVASEIPTTHIEPRQPVQSTAFPNIITQSPFNSSDSLSPDSVGSLSAVENDSARDKNPGEADAITLVGARSTEPGAFADPATLAASHSSIEFQVGAPQQERVPVQSQIETQPVGQTAKSVSTPVSGAQADRSTVASYSNSSPSPVSTSGDEKAGLSNSEPTPEHVTARMTHQVLSVPAILHENQASENGSTSLAVDSASLAREPTARKGEDNTLAGMDGNSISSFSIAQARETITAREAGEVPDAFARTHDGVRPAVRGTRALDVTLDDAGAMNSATASSPSAGEQISASGRTRVQATQPQPAIVQGQNQIQSQLEGQPVGRVPAPAASDQADRVGLSDNVDALHSQVTLARAGKSAVAGVGKVSSVALHVSRRIVTDNQLESGNHSVQAQTGSQAGDASALVRDSAGAHDAMSTKDGNADGATGTSAGSAAHETFAVLDADTRTGTPSWIYAGARRAEAGFQDPVLGWVGVRADASGGGVHATLMPGSAEAAQTLGGHMAGLNAYLAEKHTPVDTLTLAKPEGGEAGLNIGQNAGQGMNQEAGQKSSSESQSNPQPVMPAITAAVSQEIPEQTGSLGRTGGFPGHESAHISVMA